MKRANNLLTNIAEPENLRFAFWKAQKGKSSSLQVQRFREDLDENIRQLRTQILTGLVEIGEYHYFKIFDPKEREICASAFREQVVHHALMNICHPYFERVQVNESYASRPGKGVHAAVKKAASFTRSGYWFLKLDMRKFFGSIHHDALKGQLRRMFKDVLLLDILEKIIDSYETEPSRGLPIGNLTSQYFANHYLAGLDHFIKEQLRASAYVRYMDDLVLWHRDKAWLKNARLEIENYTETKLYLNLKPPLLNSTERGLPFCGYLLSPHTIRLSQRSKKRYLQKMKYLHHQYHTGNWEEGTCQRSAQALTAFTQLADTKKFRQQVLRSLYTEV